MHHLRLGLIVTILGSAAACSSSNTRPGRDSGGPLPDASTTDSGTRDAGAGLDAALRDAGPPDAGHDAGTDAGSDAGLRCSSALTACDGTCVNLRTDSANCGLCGHACAGMETCLASMCTLSCTGSLVACGGECVNLLSDPNNCGACGRVCPPATAACVLASCTIACGAGFTPCSGSCVDLASDDANCGACGRACDAMHECNGSVCTIICGAGLTACGATCVDTTTDSTNCGGCGRRCRGGGTCAASVCSGGAPGFSGATGTTWELVPPSTLGTRGLMAWVPLGYPTIYVGNGGSFGSYTPATMAWATLAGPPPGSSLAGWGSPALSNDAIWEVLSSTVVRYDPATGLWSTPRSDVTGGDNASMTVADDAGNLWAYNGAGELVRYDPVADTLSYYPAAATSPYETRLGYDSDTNSIYYGGFASSSLSRFDIASGTVTTLTPIPEGGLNDIFCSDHTGHIYAAGDFSGMTMWQYTIATDTWARIPDWPIDHGNNGSCAVAEDGWLYVEPGTTSTVYRLELF